MLVRLRAIKLSCGPNLPRQRLTRWAHRNLPRCFASRNAKRYTKQRGSLLWTTGTTRDTVLYIKQSGAFLFRPETCFYSGVDKKACTDLSASVNIIYPRSTNIPFRLIGPMVIFLPLLKSVGVFIHLQEPCCRAPVIPGKFPCYL